MPPNGNEGGMMRMSYYVPGKRTRGINTTIQRKQQHGGMKHAHTLITWPVTLSHRNTAVAQQESVSLTPHRTYALPNVWAEEILGHGEILLHNSIELGSGTLDHASLGPYLHRL